MVNNVELSEIALLLNGDRSSNYPSDADFISYGVPFVNTGHLSDGKIDYSRVDYISKAKANSLSGAKIVAEDILLCLRGTLGKYAFVEKDGGAPASSLVVIRANKDKILPRFLYYVVSSNIFQHQILIENNGSSQPNLSAKSVMGFRVPFPTKKEQQAVSNVLSDIDALIENLEKLISKKRAIKQGAMQELLTGRRRLPGYEATTWTEYRLDQICKLINGRAYAQHELLGRGKYQVLRLGNLFTNGHWYYSNLELPEKQYCVDGDLIYAWSATFGPRIWRGKKSIFHYHIWKLELSENISKEFLYHYLSYDVHTLMTELQGGTMAHLTKGTMEKRQLFIPSYNEQKAIADILSDMDMEIAGSEEKLAKYKMIKHGIMSELLTGHIRLIDKEDM